MKLKKVAPALLAIVLGCIAAKLARDSISRSRPATIAAPKVVQIVVASNNLTIGQEVRPESLVLSTITATMPPPETFTNVADVTGRVLTSPVLKGQTILNSYLAPRGSAVGLAPLVPAGMRAMTINVDEGNSLSGMLLPGCRVDVVGTLAAGKESVTRTLMKNVLIQAVGQRLTSAKPEDGKEPPPFHTVTLIVTPHQAQLLELTLSSAQDAAAVAWPGAWNRGRNRSGECEHGGYSRLCRKAGPGRCPRRSNHKAFS